SSAPPLRPHPPRDAGRRARAPARPIARWRAMWRGRVHRGAALRAASRSRSRHARALGLDRREEERTDTVMVVRRDRPRGVIRERAVAIRRDAEAGADAASAHVDGISVRLDESLDDRVVGALREATMLVRQMALPRALRERIREHRRRGLLEVVPGSIALVEHLPPEPTRILDPNDGLDGLAQDRDERRALRRVGEDVERVDERHLVPAERPPPERARAAGLRIGPRLRPTLVDRVVEQTRARIAGVLVRE